MPPSSVVAATPRAILRYLELRRVPAPAAVDSQRWSFDDVVDLWIAAEDQTHDRNVGRRVAELVPFGGFGLPEHLMVTSATLAGAMTRLVRSYSLVNQAQRLAFDRWRNLGRLAVTLGDGQATLPSYAEFVLISIRRRMELALGGSFRHTIDAGTGVLLFDGGLLAVALPGADEDLCRTIEAVAEQRAALGPSSTAERVSEQLAVRSCDLARVARRLSMSGRTLQRRLVEEGTSFTVLVDESRRTEALRRLTRGEGIKTVADATGFAEVRSFYRAFHRWTGMTPRQWLACEATISAPRDS